MIIKNIGRFILTMNHLLSILKDGFINPYKDVTCNTNNKLLILANGPSLKDSLSKIKESLDKYKNCDFSVVNDFVHDPLFTELKPKFYTLSDPLFFIDTIQKKRGLSVMNALAEKVDWEMYLHVIYRFHKSPYLEIVKKNPHIKVVYYHTNRYNGILKTRNWFLKNGLGNGEYSTVVLNSIYSAITEGYKNIELYGLDHTFFTGLTVNDDNVPCYSAQHFYDNEVEVKPMVRHYSGRVEYFDMASFLFEKYDIFKGHKVMAEYANYMGARILNCTKGSLVDAYPRLK